MKAVATDELYITTSCLVIMWISLQSCSELQAKVVSITSLTWLIPSVNTSIKMVYLIYADSGLISLP
jgi:hypothetical protein